jgi:putative tricarboxylic transport membrane protein
MGKDRFRDAEVISGAVLAALGIFIVIEARTWPYAGSFGPGPGFYPVWYGVAMTVLSLVLIGQRLVTARTADREPVDWRALGRGLSAWIAFVVAVALLRPLGFTLSFGLLTLFIVAVVFRRPIAVAAAVAVCTALALQVIFAVLLGVPLPTGWLGF